MKKRHMNKAGFLKEHWLIVLLIGLALGTALCGCRYSLIRFESMEAAVQYEHRYGEVRQTFEGNDTVFVAYEVTVTNGYGRVILSQNEIDQSYRRVEVIPITATIAENYDIRIYNYDFTDDVYMEVTMLQDTPQYNSLEISNDYGWDFQKLDYVEPSIHVSVASFSAEAGQYSIRMNGQIVKFTLR